jgi:hypothetical protein
MTPEELLLAGGLLLLVLLVVVLARRGRGLIALAGRDRGRHSLRWAGRPAAPSPPPAGGVDLRLLVQLRLAGHLGTPEEQAANSRLVQAIRNGLAGRGRGSVGAFVARGLVGLTVAGLLPSDWDQILGLVLAELEREGLLARAVVVRREASPGDASPFYSGAWPADYRGTFFDPGSWTRIQFE